MIKPTRIAVTLIAAAIAGTTAAAAQTTEAWRATGFTMPESVAYDPGTGTLFVSNINSPDFARNGLGYISQLGLDGTVMAAKFVEGLDAPKGMDVADGKLFVAGIEALSEIDIATGSVVNVYAAPGAMLLNDVAVAPDGRVFVTESIQGAVYVLENGALTEFVRDAALAGANGIVVDGGRLVIAPMGDISGGFANLSAQPVKAIDLATKAVTDVTTAPVGVLDGIEPDGDGAFTVTDNPAGKILRVAADGQVEEVAAPGAGAADHEYVAAEGLFVVPMLQTGEVVAYRR